VTFELHGTARAVLRSLVPVICPADAVPLADALVDHVALTLGASPTGLQAGFVAGLHAYDAGAIVRYLRPARALAGARAERYYQSWEHAALLPQRRLAQAFNQLLSLACYEHPTMAEQVGFRPAAWIDKVKRRRLVVHAADIDAHARSLVAPDPLRPPIPDAMKTAKRRVYGGR
jgi:hypothetical protein